MMSKNKWSPFAGLKKKLKEKAAHEETQVPLEVPLEVPPPQVAPVKSVQTDEEMFLAAMQDVKEREEFRALPQKSHKPKRKITRKYDDGDDLSEGLRELHDIVSRAQGIRIAETDEYMQWVHPRARKDIPELLHSGAISIQETLDMHGLTQDEAKEALFSFIEHARRTGLSCVKVIHGRGLRSPGGPVLKIVTARWLKGPLSKHVEGYATAHYRDGGLGATYVLIRK
jgi:DNA-nicking Smr family endonuclease